MTVSELWGWYAAHQQIMPYMLGSGVATLAALKIWHATRHRRIRQHNSTWGRVKDLEREHLIGRSGVVLGSFGRTWRGKRRVLRYTGNGNILIVARPRVGKTRSIVIPTLLEDRPLTSLLINDPKGELYTATSAYRSKISTVIQLAPCSPTSDQYNPFDAVRLNSDHETADAQLIGECCANPDGQEPKTESERFWMGLAKKTLAGLALYGIRTQEAVSPGALNSLLARGDLLQHVEAMRQASHPLLRSVGELIVDMDEKQFSNTINTLRELLSIYDDPLVSRMTEKSTFRASALRKGPQPLSVYLSVPFPHQERMRPVLRLIIRQLLDASMEEQHEISVENPDGWHYALDFIGEELPSLGRLNLLRGMLNHGAGYGIRLLLITPSMNELEEIYGTKHNFFDGTHVQVFFGLTDDHVAERVAKRIGTVTRMQRRVTYGRGGRSVSHEETRKQLLDASGVSHMPGNKVIILVGGEDETGSTQVIANQMPWYKHKPWSQRGVSHV